ncbi:MAG TPA: hypothetical protein VFH31_04080 [Pyrinomonadaceae bacterium]|nr:hypothetical protein [Pyrinomonadaceae bacterium]
MWRQLLIISSAYLIVVAASAQTLFADSISSKSLTDSMLEQQRNCRLPTGDIKLPSNLSRVQQGYLPELCMRVTFEHSQLIVNDPSVESSSGHAYTSEELAIEKALYMVRKENLESLAKLLEQAIVAEPFNEEVFWNVWNEKQQRHAEAMAPLLKKRKELAELTYKRLKDERQEIGERYQREQSQPPTQSP